MAKKKIKKTSKVKPLLPNLNQNQKFLALKLLEKK